MPNLGAVSVALSTGICYGFCDDSQAAASWHGRLKCEATRSASLKRERARFSPSSREKQGKNNMARIRDIKLHEYPSIASVANDAGWRDPPESAAADNLDLNAEDFNHQTQTLSFLEAGLVLVRHRHPCRFRDRDDKDIRGEREFYINSEDYLQCRHYSLEFRLGSKFLRQS